MTLINKPTISSGITLTRTTIRLNQQYNIPATGVLSVLCELLECGKHERCSVLGYNVERNKH